MQRFYPPPAANATTHEYSERREPPNESVAYFQASHNLKDGDDIILNNWGSRFVLSEMPNDLKLNTVTVMALRDTNSPGTHSGWLGIFGKADTPNVAVSFETVNLGKNTSLQLHGELQQEVLVGTVNITGAVPEDADASKYDTENNAAQIETWGASWNDHNGQTGARLRIGTINVEAGQSVAFSSRSPTDAGVGEDYYAGTAVTVGSVVMKEGSMLRSGYSRSGSGTPAGRAWNTTVVESLTAAGDSTVTIDNGTFNLESVAVEEGKTLTVSTNATVTSTEAQNAAPVLAGDRTTGEMSVALSGGSTLNLNAKTADQTTVSVMTSAADAGKVILGENSTLTGDKVTVTGTSEGTTGNAASDLNALAKVMQKSDAQLEGVKLVQQASSIFDGATGTSTATGVTDVKVTENVNIHGIAEMSALGLQILRNEINDMNKRMGELRDSSADANGVWARVYTGKSKYGKRSVESDYTAFQFGYDRQIQPGLWAGVALSYTDGSNDFAYGSGDSSIAALTGYVTKLFDNGAFLDGTLKVGRIDNEFDITSEAGNVKGDYDANMFSFSIEAGHRFHPVNAFFIEPQIEFMYGRVESIDYTTSANYGVKQDAAESLIGRAGFMAGLDLPNDKGNVYIRTSVLHDWKGEAGYTYSFNGQSRSLSEDLGGTWYEYGLGANFNATKNLHLYADIEAADGGEVDTDYRVNLGARWSF